MNLGRTECPVVSSLRRTIFTSDMVDLLGGGGGVIVHDKAKNNRDKIRYSNLSNNMMISEL